MNERRNRPDAGREIEDSIAPTRSVWYSPAELDGLKRARAKIEAGADPAIVARRMGLSERRLREYVGLDQVDDSGAGRAESPLSNPLRGERGRVRVDRPDGMLDNPFTRRRTP